MGKGKPRAGRSTYDLNHPQAGKVVIVAVTWMLDERPDVRADRIELLDESDHARVARWLVMEAESRGIEFTLPEAMEEIFGPRE